MNEDTRQFGLSTYIQQHKLQRLPSPALHGISPILHFLALSAHLASFRYLTLFPTPINASYGWHFQYLTIFGLLFASIAALLGSLSDILSPYAKTGAPQRLFKLKNVMLIGCAAPCELLIFSLYWSLRIWDRDLVVPKFAQMPLMVDLSFHLIPALTCTIDAIFLSPPPTVTVLQGFLVSSALAAAYWPWVESCYRHNGFWPYPIFELVGFWGRVGLFLLSAICMAANVGFLRVAYALVNGVEDDRGVKGGVTGVGGKVDPSEPEALRNLRSSVNGTLRRREDMIKDGSWS